MYKVKLVNMPFAALNIPSLALTQLKAVLTEHFGDSVEVEIVYINHAFGRYLGPELYRFFSSNNAGHQSGLGEWYFRIEAFPEAEDNSREYFDRYSGLFGESFLGEFQTKLMRKRETLGPFLEQLMEEHELMEADLAGFSSMFFQTLPSAAMARKLKSANPDLTVIMGGANCEAPMGIELAAGLEAVDFVFSGHSLVSFPKLVANLMENRVEECHQLDGVFSRRNIIPARDGGSFEARVGVVGEELNINTYCPHLDYDDFLASFDDHFAYDDLTPNLLFETSRGCWWGERSHCTFCGLNGQTMAYRSLDADKAVPMLEDLFARYGDEVSHFSSVDNIIPKNYLKEVFPKLDVPEGIRLFYEVKADLNEAQLKTLADAHVLEIQPGIEALATPTLKLMRKGTTAFNNINFLKFCVLQGVFPAWNLLVGFPGEPAATYEKYLADLPKLVHLPPPSGVFPVRFDRFSPYFTKAEHYRLDLAPLAFYRLAFPFEKEALAHLAYYFEDRNYNAKYIQDLSRYVRPLQELVADWNQRWQRVAETPADVPSLYFEDKPFSKKIYDSRNGAPGHMEIDQEAQQVLAACQKPKTPNRICQECDRMDLETVTAKIEELESAGFLFREGNSLLNLVFPRQPVAKSATMSFAEA